MSTRWVTTALLVVTIVIALGWADADALGRGVLAPAQMVPRERPRMILSAKELPKRIAWAQPGGSLNPYLESLKKTVATDNSYSASFIEY